MQQNTFEQQKTGKCRRVSGSGYVLAAVMVSGVLHATAAAWWLYRPPQILEMSGVQEVTVSLISLEPPAPEPVAETPPPPPEPELLRDDEMAEKRKIVKKKPPEKKPQPRPEPVQEQPPTPVSAAEPKPAPAPVAAARYDADYLNNPAPGYPQLSRRLGEEGQVLVRVQVSADGKVLAVELKKSSGFERLDEAALKAVAKYRFTSIGHPSSVVVPIKFNLKK